MDLTAAEIGAEEETGKGETGKEAEIGTTGILVGIIIIIIIGMGVEIGVIRIAIGMVTNTALVIVQSIAAHVSTHIATVLRTSLEVLHTGASVTTRLDLG